MNIATIGTLNLRLTGNTGKRNLWDLEERITDTIPDTVALFESSAESVKAMKVADFAGAVGGNRTHMGARPGDFEAGNGQIRPSL